MGPGPPSLFCDATPASQGRASRRVEQFFAIQRISLHAYGQKCVSLENLTLFPLPRIKMINVVQKYITINFQDYFNMRPDQLDFFGHWVQKYITINLQVYLNMRPDQMNFFGHCGLMQRAWRSSSRSHSGTDFGMKAIFLCTPPSLRFSISCELGQDSVARS